MPARFLFPILALFALFSPVKANYTFLGNALSVVRLPAGARFNCEGGHVVDVTFLTPEIFRVTLRRAGGAEPLLEGALVKREGPLAEVELAASDAGMSLTTAACVVTVTRDPCRISVSDRHGFVLCEDDRAMGMGWDGAEVRCWKAIAPDEKFFGLGEKGGNLDKRGREWVMWNSDIPGYTNDTDPLYQSIPFFAGVRGGKAYGIFFNNSYRTRFNMGAGNLRYYSFAAEQGELDYFFICGPRVPEVVERYTELTGRMPLPPKWALGYQQCRWSYYPDDEVMRIARTFREKRIPADVIYLDIHYMDGYRVFTWDRERFANPAATLRDLDRMGFKVITIIDPGVKADTAYTVARAGLNGGHFVRYPDSSVYVGEVWPGPSYFPDFSRAETRAWWGAEIGGLLQMGVDGFWNDMNEPAVWGQAFPLETIFHDEGRLSSHKKMHNLYGLLMARATYDGSLKLQPDARPFIVTRAGFAGEQRYTAVWTGDNVASEDHLELGIRMMLGLGISGVPFVGTDVGGFIGTPSPELMARWTQVGALSPFFRAHTHYGSADQEPWSFGENIEEINRQTIMRRYELLPYFYSLLWEAHTTGAPVLRPLFWNDQLDPRTYEWEFQHQLFVGDKVMAAPVTRAGQYAKAVYLPAGTWLEMNTGTVYRGKQRVLVDAPLDRLPLFLREGAIVPSQEAMQWTGEKAAERLTLDIFPSNERATFAHYEDDGATQGHTRGHYRLTEFAVQDSAGVRFTRTRVNDAFASSVRTLELRFHAVEQAPREVRVGNQPMQIDSYKYDPGRRILTVNIPEDGTSQSIEF